MGKYTGVLCAACKAPFNDKDDIVVCPVCGAPHHRACYLEHGHCALTEKHGNGFQWEMELDPNATVKGGSAVCHHCNSINIATATNCTICGASMKDAEESSNNYGEYENEGQYSTPPQFDVWRIEGVSSKELSAFTGHKSYYFLRQFKILINNRFNITWNWAALIFNFVYFFYRKMYKMGFFLLAFFILSTLPTVVCYLGPTDATVELMGLSIGYNSRMANIAAPYIVVLSYVKYFVNIICALFANKMYLKHAISAITDYRKRSDVDTNTPEYFYGLYHIGRPSKAIVAVIIVAFAILNWILGSLLTYTIL